MTAPDITLTEPIGPAGKPLLVLGHSIGTGPLIWENAVPLLANDFRISLLTLPGHGSAPVPTAPFTMAELAASIADGVRGIAGGGRVFYAGVSIGGALALQLALDHSDLFSGVASLAAGAELGTSEHWAARAALVRQQSTSVLIAGSAQLWFAPDSIAREPEMTGRILHALRDTSIEGYARCAEALGGYDLREDLGRIEAPVLAAWGEFDTVAPEAKQEEIIAGVRNGRMARIDGVAHQPPAERPDATADALLEFFSSIAR